MTSRSRRWWLAGGVAAIAVLCVPWMCDLRAPTTASPGADASPWGRWRRLTTEHRRALVERYREVSQRADAHAIFARARRFAELSERERRVLSRLNELRGQVVRETSPTHRRQLLAMSPAAQAAELHRILAAMDPSPLTRLGQPTPQ
ncbi:MAG: hypothetical protein AB7Q17_18255 [Phycisphaerae bacterium]